MRTEKTSQLAILGGPKAVTVPGQENWSPPTEKIRRMVCQMIDAGIYSQTDSGLPGELETRFREYLGAKYCLSQHNGTSTLWAAYYAAGVGPGDEVIHPGYTWICSISPVIWMGARPVFCEIEPDTLLIDPEDMEKKITPRTRAISIVHLYGNPCNMDAILGIARKHSLPVIEDCSHCHGAEWEGRKLGTLGDIGCFSMQGDPINGKPIPGGEGGLIVTNNRAYYERILLFCHLNRAGLEEEIEDPDIKPFIPLMLGLKFRLHAWSAAVGLAMMDSLDERNAKKLAYRDKIYDGMGGLPGLHPIKNYPQSCPAGFYGGFPFIYNPEELNGLDVNSFDAALSAEGVITLWRAYPLTHRMKLFAEGFDLYGSGRGPLSGDYPGYPEGSLPVTEEVHPRIVGMPVFIDPPPGYADMVIYAINKVVRHHEELLNPSC